MTAAPAAAQRHRARLSADLADHLAADSPAIEVIVDGDAASIARLARQYNVVVKRSLRRGGAVLLGERRAARGAAGGRGGRSPGGQRPVQVVWRAWRVGRAIEADAMAEGIGADQVWAGVDGLPQLSGRGVTVAVIDSGFDPKHHALKSRTLLTVDFTGGDGVDRFGHGTHVAAIIAGEAGRTADTRMYRGVAPGAYLLNLRVLGNDGSGTASDVIEAIDWAIDHRERLQHPGHQSCRSARRCCSRTGTIPCARRWSGRCGPASSSSRRRATWGRRRTAGGSWAASGRRATRRMRSRSGRSTRRGRRSGRTTWWRRSVRAGRRGTTWC